MKARTWRVAVVVVGVGMGMTFGAAKEARADATVDVGDPSALHQSGYATPPPGAAPIVVDEGGERYDEGRPVYVEPPPVVEPYRAPVRLELGPVGVTTGRGLGMGLGAAAAFGSGTVGARISAAWTRGEARSDADAQFAELGSGLAQYTGELTLDFHKRGPVHPVFGMGFGLAHVSHPQGSGSGGNLNGGGATGGNASGGSGNAGIGTARLGVEYALGFDDADVRLGAGITGVLAGPSEREADSLRGYALVGASLAIGF
jgi:hypothetical protein